MARNIPTGSSDRAPCMLPNPSSKSVPAPRRRIGSKEAQALEQVVTFSPLKFSLPLTNDDKGSRPTTGKRPSVASTPSGHLQARKSELLGTEFVSPISQAPATLSSQSCLKGAPAVITGNMTDLSPLLEDQGSPDLADPELSPRSVPSFQSQQQNKAHSRSNRIGSAPDSSPQKAPPRHRHSSYTPSNATSSIGSSPSFSFLASPPQSRRSSGRRSVSPLGNNIGAQPPFLSALDALIEDALSLDYSSFRDESDRARTRSIDIGNLKPMMMPRSGMLGPHESESETCEREERQERRLSMMSYKSAKSAKSVSDGPVFPSRSPHSSRPSSVHSTVTEAAAPRRPRSSMSMASQATERPISMSIDAITRAQEEAMLAFRADFARASSPTPNSKPARNFSLTSQSDTESERVGGYRSSMDSIASSISTAFTSVDGEEDLIARQISMKPMVLTPREGLGLLPPAPSKSSAASTDDGPQLDCRHHAVKELVDSEARHATDMMVVRDIYLARAQGIHYEDISNQVMSSGLGLGDRTSLKVAEPDLASRRRRSSARPVEPLLSAGDIQTIFGNLAAVIDLSVTLHGKLTTALEFGNGKDGSVGKVLLDLVPQLYDVCSVYCAKYDRSISRLQELEPTLRAYQLECKTLSHGRTSAWDLPSLLIKPIQRCLKYPLLLDQILAFTPLDHPDRANLKRASTNIALVAEQINKYRAIYSRGDTSTPNKRHSMHNRPSSPITTAPASPGRRLRRATRPASMINPSTTAGPSPGLRSITPGPKEDQMFDALVDMFDSSRASASRVAQEMTDFCSFKKRQLENQATQTESWLDQHQTNGTQHRRHALMTAYSGLLGSLLDEAWTELDRGVRNSLLAKTEHLLSLFESPALSIKRRNAKRQDYELFVQKRTSESRALNVYLDLTAQLLEELPAFLATTSKYYSIIDSHFKGAKEAYEEKVMEKWIVFVDQVSTISDAGWLRCFGKGIGLDPAVLDTLPAESALRSFTHRRSTSHDLSPTQVENDPALISFQAPHSPQAVQQARRLSVRDLNARLSAFSLAQTTPSTSYRPSVAGPTSSLDVWIDPAAAVAIDARKMGPSFPAQASFPGTSNQNPDEARSSSRTPTQFDSTSIKPRTSLVDASQSTTPVNGLLTAPLRRKSEMTPKLASKPRYDSSSHPAALSPQWRIPESPVGLNINFQSSPEPGSRYAESSRNFYPSSVLSSNARESAEPVIVLKIGRGVGGGPQVDQIGSTQADQSSARFDKWLSRQSDRFKSKAEGVLRRPSVWA